MEKYMVITDESLVKLSQCFSSSEEYSIFLLQLECISTVINGLKIQAQSVPAEHFVAASLREVATFVLFCREHMDLVLQLVNNLQVTHMTQQELDEAEKMKRDQQQK